MLPCLRALRPNHPPTAPTGLTVITGYWTGIPACWPAAP